MNISNKFNVDSNDLDMDLRGDPKSVEELKNILTDNQDINQIKKFAQGMSQEQISQAISSYVKSRSIELNAKYQTLLKGVDPRSQDYAEIIADKSIEGNYIIELRDHLNTELANPGNKQECSKPEQQTISNGIKNIGSVIKNLPYFGKLFDKPKQDKITSSETKLTNETAQSQITNDDSDFWNFNNKNDDLEVESGAFSFPDDSNSFGNPEDLEFFRNLNSTSNQKIFTDLNTNRDQAILHLQNVEPKQSRETFANVKKWLEKNDPRKINWKEIGENVKQNAGKNKELIVATAIVGGVTVYFTLPLAAASIFVSVGGTNAIASVLGAGAPGTFTSLGLGSLSNAASIAAGWSQIGAAASAITGGLTIKNLFQEPKKYQENQNNFKESMKNLKNEIVKATQDRNINNVFDTTKLTKFVSDKVDNTYLYLFQTGQITLGDSIPESFTIDSITWDSYKYLQVEIDKNLDKLTEDERDIQNVTVELQLSQEEKRKEHIKFEAKYLLIALGEKNDLELFEHLRANLSGSNEHFIEEGMIGENLYQEFAKNFPQGQAGYDLETFFDDNLNDENKSDIVKSCLETLNKITGNQNIQLAPEIVINLQEQENRNTIIDKVSKSLGMILEDKPELLRNPELQNIAKIEIDKACDLIDRNYSMGNIDTLIIDTSGRTNKIIQENGLTVDYGNDGIPSRIAKVSYETYITIIAHKIGKEISKLQAKEKEIRQISIPDLIEPDLKNKTTVEQNKIIQESTQEIKKEKKEPQILHKNDSSSNYVSPQSDELKLEDLPVYPETKTM
jgi:hypothetical protein